MEHSVQGVRRIREKTLTAHWQVQSVELRCYIQQDKRYTYSRDVGGDQEEGMTVIIDSSGLKITDRVDLQQNGK